MATLEGDPGPSCSTNCSEQVREEISDDNRGVNDANANHESVFSARNPMLNPVVLNELFKMCDLSNLFNFRLVSKEWHSVSLTRFRDKMTVVINYPRSTTFFSKRKQWEWDQQDASSEKKSFKSFRMKHVQFGHSSLEEHGDGLAKMYQNMNQFWGNHGLWIRKLELWQPHVHCVRLFRKVISEETPNLEELRLIEIYNKSGSDPTVGCVCCDCDEQESLKVHPNLKHFSMKPMDASPIIRSLLFLQFPNIQSIEVTRSPLDSTPIHTLTKKLTKISRFLGRKADSKFTLSELSLELSTLQQTKSAIKLLKIPLLTLRDMKIAFGKIITEGRAKTVGFLSTVFILHGHTLETLRMTEGEGASPFSNFPFQTSTFPLLTTLDLSGRFCKNLHFLKHFPNLKKLRLTGCDDNIIGKTNWSRMKKIKLHKLRCFRFTTHQPFRISQEAMEMFVKLMPKVVAFHGVLSNSSLRVVCRQWKKLRRLQIVSFLDSAVEPLDDEGITGIMAGCEERLQNITDLQELTELSIRGRANINDSSVWNGFIKMLQLQSLRVELSEKTSDEAFKALAERFPNGHGRITRTKCLSSTSVAESIRAKLRQKFTEFKLQRQLEGLALSVT